MVELLVCLGVLAVALGSVLSIFVAGTRFAAKSRQRMDASRVARAVYDLADRGLDVAGTPHGRGTGGAGKFNVAAAGPDEFYSQDLLSAGYLPSWAPAYVVDSPLRLVWKCRISEPPAGTFDLGGMYNVEITVSLDENENDAFDPEPTDEEIRRYYAILVDRTP
jgi:type II secretory pathway pseudopilin PulG